MRRQGMVEAVGSHPGQYGDRRGRDEAIEHHRDAAPARRQRGAQNGGEFAPAQRSRAAQGIAEQRAVAREPGVDGGALACQPVIVHPGAAPCPARPAATEQRRSERGRRRRIPDSHLAQTHEIGIG